MIRLWLAILCPTLFTGCVAPIKVKDITPMNLNIQCRLPQTVTVNCTVTTAEPSEVQPQLLQEAVSSAISQSGLFRKVVRGTEADYILELTLTSVQRPITGFTMSSTAKMDWKLTRFQDGRTRFQETIVSTYRENAFDTLVGATRSYSVMRGAIKKNVRECRREFKRRILCEVKRRQIIGSNFRGFRASC